MNETYPSGRVVATGYDRLNRASSVGVPGGKTYIGSAGYGSNDALASLTYGPTNQAIATETVTFDNGQNSVRWQPTAIGLTSMAGASLGLTYGYCASGQSCSSNNGNVMKAGIVATDPGATALSYNQTLTYDGLNRLSTAAETGPGTGWNQSYAYDQWGNRAVSGTLPNAGLTPTDLSKYVNNQWIRGAGDLYDAGGNQISVASNGSPGTASSTFTFDGENRMVTANVGNTGVSSYGYDGEGRRAIKAAATTKYYVYDAMGALVAEYGPSANGAGTQYVVSDTLGSTRLLLNSDGSVARRMDYLPFGEELSLDGRGSEYPNGVYPAANDAISQKFTGKERDAETGLDFFGARYLSSAQGRFTSPDPDGVGASPDDPQSWNAYAYGRNNPVLYVDSDGLRYRICDSDGKNCSYTDDTTFDSGRSDAQKNGEYFSNNQLSHFDSNGTRVVDGTFSYDGPDLNPTASALFQDLGQRAPALFNGVMAEFGKNALYAASGAVILRGLGVAAEAATELNIFRKTKVVVNFAHNLSNLRPGHLPPPGGASEIQAAVESAIRGGSYSMKANGLFEGTTQIDGVAVGFRGRFVDGVARVATVFAKY